MQKCKVKRKKAQMEGDVMAGGHFFFIITGWIKQKLFSFETLRYKADDIDMGRSIHLQPKSWSNQGEPAKPSLLSFRDLSLSVFSFRTFLREHIRKRAHPLSNIWF